MAKKKKSTPQRRGPRARGPRTTSAAQNPLLWLGAGVAAWIVWGLTAPSSASASVPSLPGATEPTGTSHSPGSAPSAGIDPHPEWPLLKIGSKNPETSLWQAVLVRGGFLPNQKDSVDGDYGPLTAAATRLLQEKGRVDIDAQVGPDTRKAANRLGLW